MHEDLQKLLTSQGEAFSLSEAALCVAQAEYPDLSRKKYLSVLEDLGEVALRRLQGSTHFPTAILRRFLFQEIGFRGNTAQYEDPRNSFLNEVLDRRLGVPITLSLIYMDVAARLGLSAYGVGMPGHFLVKVIEKEGEVLVDPFFGGVLLSEADCARRFQDTYGKRLPFRKEFLRVSSKREILKRLLYNLKNIYCREGLWGKAMTIQQMIVWADPGDAFEKKQLGLILARGGCRLRALEVLRTISGDDPEIHRLMETLEP